MVGQFRESFALAGWFREARARDHTSILTRKDGVGCGYPIMTWRRRAPQTSHMTSWLALSSESRCDRSVAKVVTTRRVSRQSLQPRPRSEHPRCNNSHVSFKSHLVALSSQIPHC